MKYSFIISAFDTQEFIEECLDSVCFQNTDKEFEVLLGIDACNKTLEKVKKIKHKYKNLRVFVMNKNVGTYIVRNSIYPYAKGTHIVQFDSDDVMDLNLLSECDKYADEYDVIKFLGQNFRGSEEIGLPKSFTSPAIYKRRVFNIFGGYENWRIVADSEFQHRIHGFVSQCTVLKVLMKRRLHNGSLMALHKPKEKYRVEEATRIIKNRQEVYKVKPQIEPHYEL